MKILSVTIALDDHIRKYEDGGDVEINSLVEDSSKTWWFAEGRKISANGTSFKRFYVIITGIVGNPNPEILEVDGYFEETSYDGLKLATDEYISKKNETIFGKEEV
jgi:hypothetical protein